MIESSASEQPPFVADFPNSEFEIRLEQAQEAMRSANVDALLISTEAELRYFTGFRTQFWQSPTRPWFLIVPADAKPIAIVPEIGATLMRSTWVEDVRTWSSPHATDDGVQLLGDVLSPMKTIGMSMGRASSLRMPLDDFFRLRRLLASAEWVDTSRLVRDLRMVKSEAEIKKISEICGVASRSFGNAAELFREGQELSDAFRAFKIELLQQGAEDVPYLVGGAGPDGYADVISPPGSSRLQAGDVLMLDTGATRHGYFCDFDRNFAIGRASDAARHAYELLWQATEVGLATARPGATCSDVYHAMAKTIGQSGGDVGRLGHALGSELTEEPSLIAWDDTILQPGMVMTLEPSMTVAGNAMMVHEENIVVRDGAPELLTVRAVPELPVI